MATLAAKLHVKPGMTMCVLDAPAGYQLALGRLTGVTQLKSPKGELDVVQIFVTRKAQLDKRLPAVVRAMGPRSMLWVSYPKAGGLGTDLDRDRLRVGLAPKGLTAVAQIAIDDVWTALRFKLERRDVRPAPRGGTASRARRRRPATPRGARAFAPR